MSAPIPAFPTRPHEVPGDLPLSELVEAYHRRIRVIVERLRLAEPVKAEAVFAHAVAALALLHALAGRLYVARWTTVRDALAADASRGAEVAAACGLEGVEVVAGLRSWADGSYPSDRRRRADLA